MAEDNHRSIVLIGFMGSGKTTIGKLIADKLSRHFIDVDQEIEKKHAISTTEIFKKYGETVFREQERSLSTHFCKQAQTVVSLGGGAFMQEEIRDACAENSLVIFLDISWKAWRDRFDDLIDTRPLLQTKSLEEIKTMFETRKKVYQQGDMSILTDDLSPEEITDTIIQSINSLVK